MRKAMSCVPRYAIFILTWAIAAVALRSVAPWIYWFTMAALPATVLLRQEKSFLTSTCGRRVLMICGALLVIHAVWACFRVQYYDASQAGTFWKDDHSYYVQATAIAESWKQHVYPEIWLKGSPPYLGTLHTGYHRPLSALFLLFGSSTLVALMLNAVCAAMFPLLVALCARYLWSFEDRAHDYGLPVRQDPAFLAAVLTALHPNQFYWAGYMMKDTYLTMVFLASMALVLGAFRRKSAPMAIASCLLLPYLFTVRIYTALSLVIGAGFVPLLRLKKKTVAQIAGIAIVSAVLVCAYTYTGNRLYEQIRDSFVALAPREAGSAIGIVKQLLAGIPRLFLAPYAWLLLDQPTPMYGLYPGMWYLYLVGYPLGFAGLAAALRQNLRLAVIPITAFGLASMLFLVAAYGGNASRQRFYLEYVVFIFAAYGIRHPSKWWIGGILIAELAFAVGQVIALP